MMSGMPSGSDDSYFDLGDYGASGTGISGLSSRTQANVQSALKAKVKSSPAWNGASDSMWGDMTPEPGEGPLLTLIKAIGGAIGLTVMSWTSILTGVQVIGELITEHTEAIATLQEVGAAMNTTAAYVGDQQDMVTFPRGDLCVIGPDGWKSTDIYSTVASPLSYGACPTLQPSYIAGSSLGHIYYAPIVVDRHGKVDELRWIGGTDVLFCSVDYYEVALCVYNPANGNVEKVWGSGDIKNGASDTTSMSEIAVSVTTHQECTPGQIIFIAFQQTAPGFLQTTRRLAAKRFSGIGRPGLLLDAASYVAPNYSEGIPSSISFASLTRNNTACPWGAVKVEAL